MTTHRGRRGRVGVLAATGAALVLPTVRAVRRWPYLAAAATGLLIVAVPSAMSVTLAPDNIALLLRLGAGCAAVGAAFLLDDPARPTTVTVPTPAWVETALRAALGAVLTAAWWAVAVAVTLGGAEQGTGEGLPVRDLTLEAAGVATVAFALGAVARLRSPRGTASTVAAPALMVLITGATLLPARLALLVAVEDPRWDAAHDRWWALLATAILTTALATLAADAHPVAALRRSAGRPGG